MAQHVPADPVCITEKFQVPQLVHLVRTDRLLTGMLQVPGDVATILKETDPAPCGEGDLGGGGEHVGPVGIARLRGQTEYVNRARKLASERVNRIRVVPEQPEIICGRAHLNQPTHHFPRIHRAGRVRMATGTHHIPLIAGSAATSSSTRSTSGPSSRMGTAIISMPRLSVIAKCRSYPGAGHRNFTTGSRIHGRGESTPPCRASTTASCINSRLALFPAMRLGTGMPGNYPNTARNPGRPCWPP